ncbi:MAG: hypothetical protein ABSH16_05725 [Sedimentisphaerales bacterium]
MDEKRYDIRVCLLSLISLFLFTLPLTTSYTLWFVRGFFYGKYNYTTASSNPLKSFETQLWTACALGWVIAIITMILTRWMKNRLLKTFIGLISFLIIIAPLVLYIFITYLMLSHAA